ncbi:MAG: hypothetical protein DMG96_30900 [Acidobacteria bacterium]|nr:MAG: hypothetical protein DMG96_30900 [Acidobacteriota bacterium]
MTRSSQLVPLCSGVLFAQTLLAQCTLPGAPAQGVPDSTFDALVTQNGSGWTGGDGTYSSVLPDGRHLWGWSDSYIGTVDPDTRLRQSYFPTAHNSLTIQDANNNVTTVGYPPKTDSYFVPTNSAFEYWMGDAVTVQPSPGIYKIKIMLAEFFVNSTTIKFEGNAVAQLAWPSLSIDSITPLSLPDLTIQWGTKIMHDSSYYYIYGIRDPGTANKLPYVARMSSVNDLTTPSKWQFWNASKNRWVNTQASATNLSGVPAITGEFTVNKMQASSGIFYLMTGMDPQNPPYPLWQNVTTYYSCSPPGPWTTRTVVYTTPETGAAGCSVGTLFTYDPRAHAEFTNSSGVLISYNVNANNGQDLVCANDYKLRFIRVAIPGLIGPL